MISLVFTFGGLFLTKFLFPTVLAQSDFDFDWSTVCVVSLYRDTVAHASVVD